MRKNRHAGAMEKCNVFWDISVRERGRFIGSYAGSYCSLKECDGSVTSWPENPFPRMCVVPSLQLILKLTTISRNNTEKSYLFENQSQYQHLLLWKPTSNFFFWNFLLRDFTFKAVKNYFTAFHWGKHRIFCQGAVIMSVKFRLDCAGYWWMCGEYRNTHVIWASWHTPL